MERALVPMIQTSIRNPHAAAGLIIEMNFSREVLWLGLALVAIVNTFLLYFIVRMSEPNLLIPAYFERPITLFLLNAGLMVVYTHAIFWAGQAIGGQGRLIDVLAVVVWFQVLWILAQAATMLISLAVPGLGALVSLAAAGWGIWVFLNFLAAALVLKSPWHALAVLMVAFVGLVLGLGIAMALLGGLIQGVLG
jgi:hypothetical protein